MVLAGGAGRRMGGVDKPALPVGGTPMRDRVLAAVVDAAPRIVVGATGDLPAGVHGTREQPPGGGPVAATAAGLSLIAAPAAGAGTSADAAGTAADGETAAGAVAAPAPAPADRAESTVALLAADLPLLTAEAVYGLRTALARAASMDGAVYVDDTGRPQWLCGVWRLSALRAALARLAVQHDGVLTGTSMRALMRELTVAEVAWSGVGPPPWFDCDTENDLHRAEEWIR
ncbi:molybdenum cofactor guanylyltransferase [Plantactinospora soyae]|uniref:molybdenum cofactor guanylyltransferase n=1 Tax=Plantactinospora soyae TaxID=1544732 RepID=UPI00178A13DE|nr:NTP transferase domain-containing protein [Plantactinospora soyae]